MRYVLARYRQEQIDNAYRIYISESLRLQGEGKYLTTKFEDFIKPRKKEEKGEDIIKKTITDLGLKFGGE